MATTEPSFAIPAELGDFAKMSVEHAGAALAAVLQSARKAAE